MEKWKDICNYEGYYQISNYGRVKSLDRIVSCNGGFKELKGDIMKPNKDIQGYLKIALSKNNTVKSFLISRLVAIHFIENPLNLPEVNHLKEKDNNYLEFLEWTSSLENQNHRQKNKKSSSMFNGVSWNKEKNKWVSRIYLKRKATHLGYFDCEKEAYKKITLYEKENNIINKYR